MSLGVHLAFLFLFWHQLFKTTLKLICKSSLNRNCRSGFEHRYQLYIRICSILKSYASPPAPKGQGWHFAEGVTWWIVLDKPLRRWELPNASGEETVGGKKQQQTTRPAGFFFFLSASHIISPQRTTEGLSRTRLPDKVDRRKQK